MSKVLDTFLTSLANSDHFDYPYDHWILDQCLPTEACSDIRSLPFPPPKIDDTEGKRDSHNESRQFITPAERREYPVLEELSAALQHPDCIRTLEETCGAQLEDTYLRIEHTQDTGGFWLGPHTDVGPKKFTMMIYLSDHPGSEGWGTDVLDTDHNIVKTVSSPFNAGMIFVPSSYSWHGFHRRHINGIRRSLIINYVTTEWRNRHELAYPDQTVSAAA